MSSTDESTETKATVDAGESESVRKEGGEEGDALMNIKLQRKRELSGSEVMMRGEQDKEAGLMKWGRQACVCPCTCYRFGPKLILRAKRGLF